jgi:hypothetical protein
VSLSTPLLAALCRAGTARIYADTADGAELEAATAGGAGNLPSEIDGATIVLHSMKTDVGACLPHVIHR